MKTPERVAVVGSSSFPLTPDIAVEVVAILRGFGDGTVFLTRPSGGFDAFIRAASEVLGRTCVVYASPGGSKNWDRDVQLVRDADIVLAFFDPDSLHREDTGTAHIVEKALDQKKPTRAWSVAHNELVFAGSMNDD